MLDDLTEDAFNSWKHHPVTKVYLRFLAKYEADRVQEVVQALRMMHEPPAPFQLGVFKGECNTIFNLMHISFGDLVAALAPPESKEE